jgi:hypothetical protein
MKKTIEMELEYLNVLDRPPESPQQLHKAAASNDDPTIEAWRDTWIKNQAENHKLFGPFSENGIGKMFGEFKNQPCIVAGAGPSLAGNISDLKEKGDIGLISCLHNFHYMVDNEVDVNYFVTLDAGKVTIEEISEGGEKDHEFYVEATKNYTLCAFVGSDPDLIKSWKGKILWYNCPIPDQACKDAYDSVEVFHHFVSNGGNVLGACVYIAKAYGGANPIVYVGADFSFGYTKNFHPWKSKYDGKLGNHIRTIDCWGNKVYTWASYLNFKKWHDSITLRVPGEWINCTEGGTWGVYPEGLIKSIKHKPLKEFIQGYRMYETMQYQAENPSNALEDMGVPGVPPQPKIFF